MDKRIGIRWVIVAAAAFSAGALGVSLFGGKTLSTLEVRRDDALGGTAAKRLASDEGRSPAQPLPAAARAATGEQRAPVEASSLPVEPATAPSLTVRRMVVTRAIQDREPAATTTIEADGKPTYAFLELQNDAAEDQTVVVRFEGKGHSVGHVKLEVPAGQERWRTWALTRHIDEPGSWTAIVATADGVTLAEQAFEVLPSAAKSTEGEQLSEALQEPSPSEA